MPTRLTQGGKPRKYIDSNHVFILISNAREPEAEAKKILRTAKIANQRGNVEYAKMIRHGVNLYRAKKLVEANA
ncbi:hypothetical protein [Pantoea sp. GM_Pan_4]|uniref:hypothetical protein n=1 Tax=Pantoea sp. GM_Pan_4 TaxID=2937389 RepID=UPI00226B0D90|nr:hypothetical protein [Pantoea sp. GM_Pan_4]